MAQNVKNINLKLDVDVLTPGNVADCVNGILEFLLYQRRQIPFVYKTYKYYIDKWAEDEETESAQDSFLHYQIQQQRNKAKATKDSISEMRELIRNAFKCSHVKSLRFLLGSSTFLPKEAYTIHIPTTVTRHHHCALHAISHGRMSQTLITLLTCEELYTLFSTEITATNMFLELELLQQAEKGPLVDTSKLFPKQVASQLPRSCKHIHLHLLHDAEPPAAALQCCKELAIFEDLSMLDLNSSSVTVGDNTDVCNKKTDHSCGWWQSDVIVRGFRSPSQKSYDLWSS